MAASLSEQGNLYIDYIFCLAQTLTETYNTKLSDCFIFQGTKGPLNKLSQCSVSDDSPISMFTPATSGLGTYSITLLQFLVRAHNDFMELYKRNAVNTP